MGLANFFSQVLRHFIKEFPYFRVFEVIRSMQLNLIKKPTLGCFMRCKESLKKSTVFGLVVLIPGFR